MKISVIMTDGGFRENTFGAKYFCQQDFPGDQYEVIWVDYYDKINPAVFLNPKVKTISLNKRGIYHSSYCFNRGIKEAQGEIIIIPDADQIVRPDFLNRVWDIHKKYEKLIVYGYRYEEEKKGILASHNFDELEDKCILKFHTNYGGCLTLRKKWLLEMNGYEQHDVFRTGIHANGLLMYSRFKNMGLAIQWEPSLKLYHPWHPYTLSGSIEYKSQHRIIQWIQSNMSWNAVEGIDSKRNQPPPPGLKKILDEELTLLNNFILKKFKINSIAELRENITQPLREFSNSDGKENIFSVIKRKYLGST